MLLLSYTPTEEHVGLYPGKFASPSLLDVFLLFWFKNLVQPHVNRYVRNPQQRSDAENEGFLGLRRAFDTYNPTKRLGFYGWAFWWVKQAVSRYLTKDHVIIYQGKKKEQPKNIGEILEEPGILENGPEAADFAQFIREKINSLPVKTRTREMLRLRIFEDLSNVEIGRRFGITDSAVGLHMLPALSLLRKSL